MTNLQTSQSPVQETIPSPVQDLEDQEESQITHVDDVFHLVLSRLNVRDICKCKCVSKVWDGLIRSQNFSMIYGITRKFVTFLKQLVYFDEDFNPESFSLELIEVDSVNGDLEISELWWINDEVCGFSNGFVCTTRREENGDHMLKVFNPLDCHDTGVELTDLDPTSGKFLSTICVFCPNHEEDSVFKIISIILMDPPTSLPRISAEAYFRDNRRRVVKIITLGVDERWRDLSGDYFGDFDALVQKPITCSGGVHWAGEFSISNFDIRSEELRGAISFPPGILNGARSRSDISLNSFGTSLILVDDYVQNSDIVLWTMDRCQVTDSWTKSVLKRSEIPVEIKTFPKSAFMQCCRGSIVAFLDEDERILLLWDRNDGSCRLLRDLPISLYDRIVLCDPPFF